MNRIIYYLFFASLLTILISKKIHKIFKPYYFSVNQLVFDDNDSVTLMGIIIMFSPTYITSIFLSYVFKDVYANYYAYFGLITGVLIVWPVFLYSLELLPYEAYKKRKTVYFLYILYIISMIIASFGGYVTFTTISNLITPNFNPIFTSLILYNDLHPLLQDMISNLIWVILGLISIKLYKVVRKYIYEQ